MNTKNISNNKSKNKNKKKIELNLDKFDKKKKSINYHNINEILKKAIIKKTHLRKNSKHLTNLNELDLKTLQIYFFFLILTKQIYESINILHNYFAKCLSN